MNPAVGRVFPTLLCHTVVIITDPIFLARTRMNVANWLTANIAAVAGELA